MHHDFRHRPSNLVCGCPTIPLPVVKAVCPILILNEDVKEHAFGGAALLHRINLREKSFPAAPIREVDVFFGIQDLEFIEHLDIAIIGKCPVHGVFAWA